MARPARPTSRSAPAGIVLVCGPAGVGKSAVATRTAELLAATGHATSLLDRYAPGSTGSWYGHDAPIPTITQECVEARDDGAQTIFVTWPLRDYAELAELRRAMPWAQMTVCRLRSPDDVLLERIAAREDSFMRLHLQELALEASAGLERSGLGDLVLDTSQMSTDAAAAEIRHHLVEGATLRQAAPAA
jgi:gluconate kinase